MSNTTTETLSVNGVVLNTLAKNIESLAGRLRRAPVRTGNIAVPARHGNLWTPNKKFDVATISLPMWVAGCDDDGHVPLPARQEFYKNVDALMQLFSPSTLLDVRHTLPDASVRQCFAEVLDIIDIDTSSAGGFYDPVGKFSVSLTVPYPFWQDINLQSQTFHPGAGVTTYAMNLTSLAGAGVSAPIEDAIITITGPCNNPAIDTGLTLCTYGANLTSGQVLTIDSGAWTLAGSGGLTPNVPAFSVVGDARFCVIPAPANGATPVVTFKCTGGATSATSVKVQARRKFMVG